MCKILIVEQNITITEEMIHLLKQHFPQIQMLLHAVDYQNALSLCNTHYPNLVLTQVNDNHEKCFNFIENIKGMYNNINVVLLIDENDTSVLKFTLRKRNERFILKPLDHKNFLKIMHDCIFEFTTSAYGTQMVYDLLRKVEQYRPIIEHTMIEQIVSNTPKDLIMQNICLLNTSFHEGLIAVTPKKDEYLSIIDTLANTARSLSLFFIHSHYYHYYVLFIFSNKSITSTKLKRLHAEMERYNAQSYYIYASDPTCDISTLYHAFIEAVTKVNNASDLLLHFDTSNLDYPFTINDSQIDYYARHIFHHCLMLNDEYVDTYTRKISTIISIFDLETIQTLINALIQKITACITYAYHIELNIDLPVLSKEHDINEIHHNIMQYYRLSIQKIDAKRKDTSHLTLRKVLLDVLKHYTNCQLNLQETAERLELSTFYICKLFKKYTKSTFVDYINDCRIESAKTYLKTDMKIKNIAYEVGFQSTTYFGRVFKSKLGITPKEYRTQRYFYFI